MSAKEGGWWGNGKSGRRPEREQSNHELQKESNAMRTKIRVAAVTVGVGVAVPAFLLGSVVFPPADIGVEPTPSQMPHFLLLGLTDALLLGIGIAFLIFGLPVLRRVSPDSRGRAWAMYLSRGYLTVSWWPHLGMHAANGLDLGGQLVIEYLFHLPLEVAGVVLAYSFFSLFRSWRSGRLAEANRVKNEALTGEAIR
jgi:hypothetical protein